MLPLSSPSPSLVWRRCPFFASGCVYQDTPTEGPEARAERLRRPVPARRRWLHEHAAPDRASVPAASRSDCGRGRSLRRRHVRRLRSADPGLQGRIGRAPPPRPRRPVGEQRFDVDGALRPAVPELDQFVQQRFRRPQHQLEWELQLEQRLLPTPARARPGLRRQLELGVERNLAPLLHLDLSALRDPAPRRARPPLAAGAPARGPRGQRERPGSEPRTTRHQEAFLVTRSTRRTARGARVAPPSPRSPRMSVLPFGMERTTSATSAAKRLGGRGAHEAWAWARSATAPRRRRPARAGPHRSSRSGRWAAPRVRTCCGIDRQDALLVLAVVLCPQAVELVEGDRGCARRVLLQRDGVRADEVALGAVELGLGDRGRRGSSRARYESPATAAGTFSGAGAEVHGKVAGVEPSIAKLETL